MAVTRSNVGTDSHQTANSQASPLAATATTVTISAGDTGLFVAATYAGQGLGSQVMVASCKAEPAGANVTVPIVSGTHVEGFGATDNDGWADIFFLADPVTSLGTGSKQVQVTVSGWAGTPNVRVIQQPWTVTGATNVVTGGHATSVNGASTISSGSLTVGSGGYGVALAGNGTAAPTVNTGTSLLSTTGSTSSGCDNVLTLDETANGALIANVNSADESQLCWVTITAGAGSSFDPPLSVPPAQYNVHRM